MKDPPRSRRAGFSRGGVGLQQEDHARFAISRDGNTESPEQERRGGHVADAVRFELFPLASLCAAIQFDHDLAAEFDEDRRHGLRRQIRPQAVRPAEHSHQHAGLSVHVQDAGRGGQQNHAAIVRIEVVGQRRYRSRCGTVDRMAGLTEGGS